MNTDLSVRWGLAGLLLRSSQVSWSQLRHHRCERVWWVVRVDSGTKAAGQVQYTTRCSLTRAHSAGMNGPTAWCVSGSVWRSHAVRLLDITETTLFSVWLKPDYTSLLVGGKKGLYMMKFKPNQTRTYDVEGFKRRAACLCFRNETEDEVSCEVKPFTEGGGFFINELYFWLSPKLTALRDWVSVCASASTRLVFNWGVAHRWRLKGPNI